MFKLILALVLVSMPAVAENPKIKVQLAKKAMAFSNPKKALERAQGPMANNPVFKHVIAKMDYAKVENEAALIMTTMFSTDELNALVKFHSSALGKSINSKLPKFQQIMGGLMQEEMKRVFSEEAAAGRLPATQAPKANPNLGNSGRLR